MARGPVAEIKLDTRKLDLIIRLAPERAKRILDTSAVNIQRGAQTRTQRVDTGAMKSAWYVRGGDKQIDPEGVSRNPGHDQPPVAPSNDYERIIGNAMEYTIHHEFGTSRGISPMPMLRPAVEEERQRLTDRWKELCEGV